MFMVAMIGAGRRLPSRVVGLLASEFLLFLFFLASDVARAGLLESATCAAVVDLGSVSLGSLS